MKEQNQAKIIIHIDMDAFFCSVACLINPYLRGKVFAIGRENTYRGVISSASYEARAFGIHAAMSQKEAYALVPNLIIVSLDYANYVHYHNEFLKILYEYSDLIEVASIDEAYVDITKIAQTRHPLVVAKEIQKRILKEVGLSSSIGIAPTLFLAKMASDLKKPLGITVLRKRDVKQILYPLSVSKIYGIGKKTYPTLINHGVNTIGDFMEDSNQALIVRLIGQNTYDYVISHVLGKSSNVVDPHRYDDCESISTSQTFDRVINSETEILYELRKMTREVVDKLNKDNYYTKTISITFRNINFQTITRSISLDDYVNDFLTIFDVVTDLVEEHYKGDDLRLLGVGVSNLKLKSQMSKEYNLFTISNSNEKEEIIADLINIYQKKYGEKALFKRKK